MINFSMEPLLHNMRSNFKNTLILISLLAAVVAAIILIRFVFPNRPN